MPPAARTGQVSCLEECTAAASGRPDNKAIVWVQTAFDKSIPIEDLAIVPRRFRILSRKMSSKFQSVATGQLGLQITQVVEEWLLRGEAVPALVLLREIVNYYDTGNAPGNFITFLTCRNCRLGMETWKASSTLGTWY